MGDVLVLCYHALSPTWTADLSVTPDNFERQLGILLERGYHPVTFSEAVHAPSAPRTVAITFDDGFASVHAIAWPILRRLGVPATLFVPSALVGSGRPLAWPGIDHWLSTPHAAELAGMSWEQVLELRDDGWEIGSHTRTHPHLTTIDDAMLSEELELSKAEIETRLGEECRSIAYPYGDVDARVVAAAQRAGYAAAAGLPPRLPRRSEPFDWPRTGVYYPVGDAAFRRRLSRPVRRLAASPVWPVVERVLPPVRRVQRRLIGRGRQLPTPALRLFADRPRVARNRAVVLIAGAAARAGSPHVYTLWPSASAPAVIVEAGHAEAARWLREVFEPAGRGIAALDPASWNVARAGALMLRGEGGRALVAAEHALGRTLDRPRLAAFSPTGAVNSKVTCFVFEGASEQPSVVVKAMADPAQDHRLVAEIEAVEDLRTRLARAAEVSEALPLAPLWTGSIGGEYLVVQPLDPLAAGTGRADPATAHRWLRGFHDASASGVEAWAASDERGAREVVVRGWGYGRPSDLAAVEARVEARSRGLLGAELPVCAVHGDFWRGNIAAVGGRLRVYDWEWTKPSGRPLFDIWSYELAELRELAEREASERELRDGVATAVQRVEEELRRRGIDERFALATLPPAFADLSFRIRAATGRPGGGELGAVRLMAVVAAVLR